MSLKKSCFLRRGSIRVCELIALLHHQLAEGRPMDRTSASRFLHREDFTGRAALRGLPFLEVLAVAEQVRLRAPDHLRIALPTAANRSRRKPQ